MTNSYRFTKYAKVSCIAFVAVVLSIGKPTVAHAERAVSPNEAAAAAVLGCFETWLDRPVDVIAAVECIYRGWQMEASAGIGTSAEWPLRLKARVPHAR